MKSEAMRGYLTQYANIAHNGENLKFDDANFEASMKSIFNKLKAHGKVESQTSFDEFFLSFKQ